MRLSGYQIKPIVLVKGVNRTESRAVWKIFSKDGVVPRYGEFQNLLLRVRRSGKKGVPNLHTGALWYGIDGHNLFVAPFALGARGWHLPVLIENVLNNNKNIKIIKSASYLPGIEILRRFAERKCFRYEILEISHKTQIREGFDPRKVKEITIYLK